MYDTAIIGAGPAGFSAALSLQRRGKDLIWFGNAGLSAKVEKAEEIANYPGVGRITGAELNRRFAEHMREMDLSVTEKKVTNVLMTGDTYQLLAGNDLYEARTILLAIGAASEKGFPGEQEYVGRGVSYCATCDGPLCKGKTIAVYCGSPDYEHEVKFLAEMAEKIYLCASDKTGEAAAKEDAGAQRSLPPNGEFLPAPIERVEGEERITAVVLTDGTRVAVDAFFCLRDAVSPAALLPELILNGENIAVGRSMETNLHGCYAAGDCTGRPYQIAKAVGEGNVAAHSILKYLK